MYSCSTTIRRLYCCIFKAKRYLKVEKNVPEDCSRRENERLSEWFESCASSCDSHCDVSSSVSNAWRPHCVCKVGFSRLPNGKCVSVDDPRCTAIRNPTTTSTTTTSTTPIPTPTTPGNRFQDFRLLVSQNVTRIVFSFHSKSLWRKRRICNRSVPLRSYMRKLR